MFVPEFCQFEGNGTNRLRVKRSTTWPSLVEHSRRRRSRVADVQGDKTRLAGLLSPGLCLFAKEEQVVCFPKILRLAIPGASFRVATGEAYSVSDMKASQSQ